MERRGLVKAGLRWTIWTVGDRGADRNLEYLFPEEEGKDYGKEDFDLEIADGAGNNETAKNADIAEIPSKTKEYLNEKNAVDEESDKKLSMPVKKTSALLDVRYTSLRQPYDSYTSLTERPGYLRLRSRNS